MVDGRTKKDIEDDIGYKEYEIQELESSLKELEAMRDGTAEMKAEIEEAEKEAVAML